MLDRKNRTSIFFCRKKRQTSHVIIIFRNCFKENNFYLWFTAVLYVLISFWETHYYEAVAEIRKIELYVDYFRRIPNTLLRHVDRHNPARQFEEAYMWLRDVPDRTVVQTFIRDINLSWASRSPSRSTQFFSRPEEKESSPPKAKRALIVQ